MRSSQLSSGRTKSSRRDNLLMTTATLIRPASPTDAAALCEIYNPYVLETTISFEQEAVSEAEMAQRVAGTHAVGLPWLVAEDSSRVVAYAYASKWKGRCAYRFAVETSVYVAKGQGSKGLGTTVYEALFADLRRLGMHTAIGGIAQPNPASVALHERMGMKQVAFFEEVGYKFGRRIDVGYWQVRLSP